MAGSFFQNQPVLMATQIKKKKERKFCLKNVREWQRLNGDFFSVTDAKSISIKTDKSIQSVGTIKRSNDPISYIKSTAFI